MNSLSFLLSGSSFSPLVMMMKDKMMICRTHLTRTASLTTTLSSFIRKLFAVKIPPERREKITPEK